MTTTLSGTPVNSDAFLAPAHCKHKNGSDDFVRSQNADREKIVCAVGIDTHYDLDIVANESGSSEPRLAPFNPRMHGPGCPPMYAGLTIPEEERTRHRDDPVALGRALAAAQPYDKALYQKKDPRLTSRCVVVRDYGCKIPIDVADTEKIARAVLNYYPDEYVKFLGEFVSNLFGQKMHKFLEMQIAGYQQLLDHPEELNRTSWNAYMSVQGGVEPASMNVASVEKARNVLKIKNDYLATLRTNGADASLIAKAEEEKLLAEADVNGASADGDYDVTLPWSSHMGKEMNSLARDGSGMTGNVACQDYDLRPCLKQHIETLKTMRDEWCRGFGSKEEHVLAMLYFANHEGRKLTQDLRLMTDQPTPDYDRVVLHTPVNMYHSKSGLTIPGIPEPDANACIVSGLAQPQGSTASTPSMLYPVGNWSGSAEATYNFLSTTKAPYMWGWGHPGNLAVGGVDDKKGTGVWTAPYLRYTVDGGKLGLKQAVCGTAYVNKDKWSVGLADASKRSEVIGDVAPTKARSLRESLMDPADHPFRAVLDSRTKLNRLTGDAPAPCDRPDREFLSHIDPPACDTKLGYISVLNPKLFKKCEYLDPFVRHGGACFRAEDGIKFPAKLLMPYTFSEYKHSSLFKDIFRKMTVSNSFSTNMGMLAGLEDTSQVQMHLAENAFKNMFNDMWPWQTLTVVAQKGDVTDMPWTQAGYAQFLDSQPPSLANLVNMQNYVFPEPDKMVGLDMAEIGVKNEADRLALQILLLRKTIQYSMGMDVALVICSEPIPTAFNGPSGAANAFKFYDALWKREQWPGTWVHNAAGKWVLQEDGVNVPTARMQEILMRATLNTMLKRLQAFYKNEDESAIRHMCTEAGRFAKATSSSSKPGWFISKPGFESAPTELLFQKYQNVQDQDPRALFAGTFADYDEQIKSFDGLQNFAPQGVFGIDSNGYALGGSVSSSVIDAWASHCVRKFAEGLKMEGMSSIVEAFLQLKDPTPKVELPFKGFRGSGLPYAADNVNGTIPVTPLPAGQFPFNNATIPNPAPGPQSATSKDHFLLLPADGRAPHGPDPNSLKSYLGKYNVNLKRSQLFATLDAAALLWNAREFHNPADCNRPKHDEHGNQDDQHYWCLTMIESFLSAREAHKAKKSREPWELEVKRYPGLAFPATMIGALCDDSFSKYFPLLPPHHALRDHLRKVRSLDMLWGTLPSYTVADTPAPGAWMPVSASHRARLLDSVGLFDSKIQVPSNPWLVEGGRGIGLVYNQSYHSVYYCDMDARKPDTLFNEWVRHACRYQPPRAAGEDCFYPFSQYGGTPVEGDFLPHKVEAPGKGVDKKRHAELVYNRFGFTAPLRTGQQFHDTGLLQDLFSFDGYRPYADLTKEQRQRPAPQALFLSNFMAYSRTHAIIALASCNHGSMDGSAQKITRNLFRVFVDSVTCQGAKPDDDGVPVILGFTPVPVQRKDDRAVVLYAGTLSCLNSKLKQFCEGGANRGERVCALYKSVYLNDAALLFTRLLRAERRKRLHDANFLRAQVRRGQAYTRQHFDHDLIDLQDSYINWLQTTILAMLIQSGADMKKVPLHLLEPRELEVSATDDDDNVLPTDFLSAHTQQMMQSEDFSGDTLNKKQLAQLALLPANDRILGTLQFQTDTKTLDFDHIRKQIMQQTAASNKNVYDTIVGDFIKAHFSKEYLERQGEGVDFGFDESAIKDPLTEAGKFPSHMTTRPSDHMQSSLRQSLNADSYRTERGAKSVAGMNQKELGQVLQEIRKRVDADHNAGGGTKAQCLTRLVRQGKVPNFLKEMLKSEYQGM